MNVCRTALIPILAATVPFLGYAQQSGSSRSGTLTPPVAIYKVSPTHSEDLYRKAIEGEAVVSVTVDIFGNATDPQVESASQPKFGEAAMKAASEWIFEPATKDGTPTEVRAKLPFVFEIAFEHKMNVEIGRKVFVELSGPIIPSSELAEDLCLVMCLSFPSSTQKRFETPANPPPSIWSSSSLPKDWFSIPAFFPFPQRDSKKRPLWLSAIWNTSQSLSMERPYTYP